jgi:DNA repair exonuclease SbcCD ATPase subunit
MRLSLKKLVVSDFRSFVGESVLSDLPTSGLFLVSGQNTDTGGSSGAGKSSINLAISYALGFCPYPATSHKSWYTDATPKVELTLATGVGEVVIARSPKLAITIDGEKVLGTAASLENKIQEITGLNSELLQALTYRKQRSAGMFLSRTDASKKEFLTSLLGLEKIESAIEDSQNKIKKYELDATLAENKYNTLEAQSAEAQKEVVEPIYKETAGFKKELEGYRISKSAIELEIDTHKSELTKLENDKNDKFSEFQKAKLEATIIFKKEIARATQEPLPEIDRVSEYEALRKLNSIVEQITVFANKNKEIYKAKILETSKLQKQLDRMRRESRDIELAREEGVKIIEQIEVLEQNKCPTCEQTWLKALDKKAKLEERLVVLMNKIEEGEARVNVTAISSIESQIQELQSYVPESTTPELEQQKKTASEEYNRIQTDNKVKAAGLAAQKNQQINDLNTKLNAVEHEWLEKLVQIDAVLHTSISPIRETLELLGKKLLAETNQEAKVRQLLTESENFNKYAKQEYDKKRNLAETLLKQRNEALVAFETVKAVHHAELDFNALIGRTGFLGAIFEQVLAEISTEVNNLLGTISNVSHVTLNFKTESETQKGTIKKSIVPIINVGGNEAPLASGLSGGMQSAVELAVDFAVSEVISRRTGSVPGWILLDECFEGLSVIEKEGIFQILQKYAQDKLILVIDHATDFKSKFDKTIEIEYKNGISRIVL